MSLMGIDVGTTNMKCIIIAHSGQLLNLVVRPSALYTLAPGGKKYIDGERLFNAVVRMCEETWGGAGNEKLRGISITSVGCAPVILNKYNVQLDATTSNRVIEPMPELSNEEYRDICGYSKDYGCGMHSILPFISGVTEPLAVMSVGDYLNCRFTGIKRRDRSTAGSVTLLDRRTGENWYNFLYEHRINYESLPPLCNSGDYIGDLINPQNTALPEGTPVFAGGHDYLCAAFAAGCYEEDSMINVLGTYEMLASFYKKQQNAPEAADFVTFMDWHVFPMRYTVTAEMPATGTKAAQVRKSAKMFAYQEDFVDKISTVKIKVVGGGSKNKVLVQSKAFINGLRLYVPQIPEATATGAALIAGVGSGVYNSFEKAARVYRNVDTVVFYPEFKKMKE